MGLFGYDITCLALKCSEGVAIDASQYCDMVKAKGLDGLSFGVYWTIDVASGLYYCVGFHSEERNDKVTCATASTFDTMNY